MLHRSIPGYDSLVKMTTLISTQYARPNTRVYDLGCSLGTSLFYIRQHLSVPCELIGIDTSPSMIETCQLKLDTLSQVKTIQTRFECQDIVNTPLHNASMVIMNYTLQFVPEKSRQGLIQNIFDGLNPGGVFLFSEKIRFDDEQKQTLYTDLYHRFKQHQGYSLHEIKQKSTALKNILIPDTQKIHGDRLTKAGFHRIEPWFQSLQFMSFIAHKPRP